MERAEQSADLLEKCADEDENTDQEAVAERDCKAIEDPQLSQRHARRNKVGLLCGLALFAAGLCAHRWILERGGTRSIAASPSLADEVRLAAAAVSTPEVEVEEDQSGVSQDDAEALALKAEVEELKSKLKILASAIGDPQQQDEHDEVHSMKKKEKTQQDGGGEEHHVPVHTFYMYRACDDKDWPMENVNTGNLAGVLWYLHNEVVNTVPRKFGITRIRRLKFQVAGTRALKEKNMTFGVRFAYDGQTCTGAGPWATPVECDGRYQAYGNFVGCNNLGQYPFPTAAKGYPCHYPGAVWYSLPKKGRCHGRPTGQEDCTYSYEDAGAITIDKLVGISDYWGKVNSDSDWKEYDSNTDQGNGFKFWDWKYDDSACEHRLEKVRKVWDVTYPDMQKDTDIPSPTCDFDCDAFYPEPPSECHTVQPTGKAACHDPYACSLVAKAYHPPKVGAYQMTA